MASRMGLRLRPRSVRLYSTRGVWFFTYRLTLWPIAAVLPFFVLLGTAVPAASCRAAQKRPVVERLRVE